MCRNFGSMFRIHIMWFQGMMCKLEITLRLRPYQWGLKVAKWRSWEARRYLLWKPFGEEQLVKVWHGSWKVRCWSLIQSCLLEVHFRGRKFYKLGRVVTLYLFIWLFWLSLESFIWFMLICVDLCWFMLISGMLLCINILLSGFILLFSMMGWNNNNKTCRGAKLELMRIRWC